LKEDYAKADLGEKGGREGGREGGRKGGRVDEGGIIDERKKLKGHDPNAELLPSLPPSLPP